MSFPGFPSSVSVTFSRLGWAMTMRLLVWLHAVLAGSCAAVAWWGFGGASWSWARWSALCAAFLTVDLVVNFVGMIAVMFRVAHPPAPRDEDERRAERAAAPSHPALHDAGPPSQPDPPWELSTDEIIANMVASGMSEAEAQDAARSMGYT